MTDPVAAAARAAARRLASDFGPGLIPDVETALHADRPQRRDQYFDVASVAGLIVSIATLAWTVYNDLKNKTANPSPEVVARTVRVELHRSSEGDPPTQDRITEVVVTEIMNAADGSS